jgi:membrane protein YqaA with SNARE-associated domain
MSAGSSIWTRRFGTPAWDAVIRGTGVVGLLAIPLVLLVPATAGMVVFTLVAIWMNGPAAVVVPAGFEPILLLFGELYPPLLVAVVGTLAATYIEFFNYHMFRGVLALSALRPLRENRLTRAAVALFERQPFFAVWLMAWTPIPFTIARILSAIAKYPAERHLLAVTLGRFPRFWLFAVLGDALDIPTLIVWGFLGLMLAIGVSAVVWRWRRRRAGAGDGGAVTE